MALLRHRPAALVADDLDDLFDGWMRRFPTPWATFGDAMTGFIRVDELEEGGELVIRADMPGIDPEKDMDISVAEGMLTIRAERRLDEKTEDNGYVRRERRYGSFRRTLPLPAGVSESDVKASYKDGTIEIRVPVPPAAEAAATHIPITKG